MYFRNWEELEWFYPLLENGTWDRERLYEYLVWSCHRDFTGPIDAFMARHRGDEQLVELLFQFLLCEDYDGSDSQMGAARYIARLDRELLRQKRDLLLRAQQNEVLWKRPFWDDQYLEWL